MKTIITHIGPDLDAICSIWLAKTFLHEWTEADFAFVPAGKTYHDLPPDENPDILHVDTGMGKFDHHQTDADICASLLVYREIESHFGPNKALERMVMVVNDVDHFREVFFPNPTGDYWDMGIMGAIDGWRLIYSDNPAKVVALGMEALDGIYKTFQNKVWAEKELEAGYKFETKWGMCMYVETVNDETVHLGQKAGYMIVIRKDPNKGYLRVKSLPKPEIDLTHAYERFKTLDPKATWFLHASHHMILNGSAKNPDMVSTSLTKDQIIDILKGE